MDGFNSNPRARLAALIAALILLSLLPQSISAYYGPALQSLLTRLLSPATQPLTSLASNLNPPPADPTNLTSDPNLLAQQVLLRDAQLINLTRQLNNLRSENAELQNLRSWLGDSSNNLPASVIATIGSGTSPAVRINVGTTQGVRVADPVVQGPYLIGRILEANATTSVVGPITSPDALLEAVLLPSDRTPAHIDERRLTTTLLRPQPSGLLADELVDARLPAKPGYQAHLLENSGLHVWPESVQGWIIGTVAAVQPNPTDSLRQIVYVKPHLTLHRLHRVTVITTPLHSSEPATAQGGTQQ